MTQLICPLCGRFVSLAYFDPTGFDLDIYRVEVTGLGRGRGVKVTGTYSILDPTNPTIKLIKDRILELSKILLENQCLNSEEVLSALKIQTVHPTEVTQRDKVIKNLSDEADSLRAQVNDRNKVIKDLSENCETLDKTLLFFKCTLTQKHEIITTLTEQTINLNDKVSELTGKLEALSRAFESKTEQAEKLFEIAKEQESRIVTLEEQIASLSETLING